MSTGPRADLDFSLVGGHQAAALALIVLALRMEVDNDLGQLRHLLGEPLLHGGRRKIQVLSACSRKKEWGAGPAWGGASSSGEGDEGDSIG